MKCRKDRYAVTISEASYVQMRDEAYRHALQDGVQQGVAAALLALEKGMGWRKKRLSRVVDIVNRWLAMPDIFGKSLTGDDVIRHMKEAYGIDMDTLKIEVQL